MSHGTIGILVASEYEDLEVWYPKLRLEEAGYTTWLIGLGEEHYLGKHGYPCKPDKTVKEVRASELTGLLVPGGWAPDKIRRDPAALLLVREVFRAGKLLATICHGPWVLISAGVVKGKKMTSTPGIHDDVTNAGAEWVDEPAVTDGNLVSARVPRDLPAFAVAMLKVLEKQQLALGAATMAG
jgi:protease I